MSALVSDGQRYPIGTSWMRKVNIFIEPFMVKSRFQCLMIPRGEGGGSVNEK